MARYIFAAARDGSMLLSWVDAEHDEAATDAALAAAADHHGLKCEPEDIECNLDGFVVILTTDLIE